MSVEVKVDVSENKRKFKAMNKKADKAVERTCKDFASRGHGWIKKAVKEVYTVDAAGLASAGPRVRISGGGGHVKSGIKYVGRRLTLKHFKFNPKSMPGLTNKKMIAPGGAVNFRGKNGGAATLRRRKNTKLKTTILKGQTVVHGKRMFVISGRGNGLPWQKRSGGDGTRGRVQMVHTVGMPQMVAGDKAKPKVDKKVQEETKKRFDNAVSRLLG